MTKIKDKERILNAARERQTATYKGNSTGYQQIFLQKLYRPEGSSINYLMYCKGRTYNQESSTRQGYHSELKERLNVSQINKR